MSKILLKVAVYILLQLALLGCGEVVSSLDYSKVVGQDLRWGSQSSINVSNISSYQIAGQCIGDLFVAVDIDIGNPPAMQITLPCNNNRYESVLDLSGLGLTNGPMDLIANQVGVPFQAITNVLVGSVAPFAPSIATPMTGSTLISTVQTLTGTCQAGNLVSVTGDILGSPATTTCELTGNYNVPITLTASEGVKVIDVVQEDIYGNISPIESSTVTLVLPPVAPVITGPSMGLTTRFVSQTIQATCEPGATVSVNSGVDMAPVTGLCSMGGTVSIPVSLTVGDGPKVININQTNIAGTSPQASITINLDTLAPGPPTITAPVDMSYVNNVVQPASGSCEAAATVTLSGNLVAPVDVVCAGTNTYSTSITLTAGDGLKNISALQTDVAGNISTSTGITVNLDATAPTVLITSPSPDPTTVIPISYTITFSELTTGFVQGDIVVTNGSISSFVGGPLVYDIVVNPTLLGPVIVSVPAGVAVDIANNQNQAGSLSFTYGPSMTLSVFSSTTVDLAIETQGNVTWDIDWGDGTQSLNRPSNISSFVSKTYATPFTGQVRVYGLQPTEILRLNHNTGRWNYNISVLPVNLTTYRATSSGNLITGDISVLPAGLTSFHVSGANTTTGDIANLPAGLTNYVNQGRNTTFGDIGNLPVGLISYSNFGDNTTSGDIANLPAVMNDYTNYGSNTTSGNLINLPPNLTTYTNQGSNTVTGDIADMPSTIEFFRCRGLNTVFGDVANIPAATTYFEIDPFTTGLNTTTGTFSSLKEGLLVYVNGGQNTVTGSFADLPDSLTTFQHGGPSLVTGGFSGIKPNLTDIYILGTNTFNDDIANLPGNVVNLRMINANTIFGNITNIPASVATLHIDGSNTLTGNIANLKPTLLSIILEGNNTVSGDIGNLGPMLTRFEISGNNTITGNIANLPPLLNTFTLQGSNTTFGSINTLSANMRRYRNRGLNTTTATGTGFLPTTFELFDLNHAGGFRSQTEIDNILISLSNVLIWESSRLVDLRGTSNSAPGAAGIAARAVLISNNAIVNNN